MPVIVCEICGGEGPDIPDEVHQMMLDHMKKAAFSGEVKLAVICCPDCSENRQDQLEAYCNSKTRPN